MSDDTGDFNMSLRKFLKRVGVTSQQAIEEGLRNTPDTAGKTFKARMVLTVEGLGVDHEVTGTLADEGKE